MNDSSLGHSSSPAKAAVGARAVLDREKALVLSAVAAHAWCGRTAAEASKGRRLVGCLMEAAAWASRARRHSLLEPLTVDDLVGAFERPASEWLPGAGEFSLVEDGHPTPICLDYAEDAGGAALEEVEQAIIKMVMANIGGRADAAEQYTRFRRFLVEHAHAPRVDAAKMVRSVGLDLARVYGPIAGNSRFTADRREIFFPCPRCRWPMAVRNGAASCARSPTCLTAGARYSLRGDRLLALGPLEGPPPVACDGSAALLPGVWRFTVLPGLEELALAGQLEKVPGARVELWPYLDAYDLDVRVGDQHWRVDVKDHVSAMRLAGYLRDRPATDAIWIVVPDLRRDQVPILRQNVPSEAGYRFAYAGEFVRRVKGAA